MPDQEANARLNTALSGRYRIERQLGEGGMATVYLADDVKHHRSVALKVLKPELAALVGVERFLAEIETTAHLQHPNILPLFDSGEADGLVFFVMPYVEDETLRERLDREKQLPVDEAVKIATEVAEALDHAHRRGIVHRDVKPANILLREGRPLVADFGIALAASRSGGGERLTETGMSLGTPYYMSPEQATGSQEVGPATDVYALGCVLYEMLVGEPPYTGSTPQAVLGRIIAGEAKPPSQERRTVPANVDAAIRKSIEKLPADRFASAGAFAEALADERFRWGEPVRGDGRTFWKPLSVGLVALSLVLAVFLGWALLRPESAGPLTAGLSGPVFRFEPELPTPYSLARSGPFDISPDGSQVVYQPSRPQERDAVVVVGLDGSGAHELPGTEGAFTPLFSPDGGWIAYGATGGIYRVPAQGGIPQRVLGVSDADPGFALSAWDSVGGLYYWDGSGATFRLRDGGEPERIPIPRFSSVAGIAPWVRPLPGRDAVLLTRSATGTLEGAELQVLNLEDSTVTTVADGGFDGFYLPTGHIVYARGDRSLVAVPFDVDRLEVTGNPVPVLNSVEVYGPAGKVAFAVSRDGTAVYAIQAPSELAEDRIRVARVDTSGAVEVLPLPPGRLRSASVSPDGRSLAYTRGLELHLYDLVTGSDRSIEVVDPANAVWSKDGSRIAYTTAFGSTDASFKVMTVDGSAETDSVSTGLPSGFAVESWHPDGHRVMAAADLGSGSGGFRDLVVVDVEDGTTTPYLDAPWGENWSSFSPDGRWVVYESDQTADNSPSDNNGPWRVLLRSFPDPGPAIPVSGPGDAHAGRWSPDGRTIYYLTDDSVYAVDFHAAPNPSVGGRRALFARTVPEGRLVSRGYFPYDVHPDGGFVMLLRPNEANGEGTEADAEEGEPQDVEVRVVVNWFRELLERIGGPE